MVYISTGIHMYTHVIKFTSSQCCVAAGNRLRVLCTNIPESFTAVEPAVIFVCIFFFTEIKKTYGKNV